MTVRKTDSRAGRIAYEVSGLNWLAEAGEGAAAIVPVLAHSQTWLEEPRLPSVPASRTAAQDFGRALAYTHAAGASHLGAGPRGFTGEGWMGEAHLPLLHDPGNAPTSWGAFYAEYRLLPYLDSSPFTPDERHLVDTFLSRLSSGIFDHDEPALLTQQGHSVARIHGDLWNGNLIWTPSGAVLIDPAAQGGHAEEDLAALALFGCPFLDDIVHSYDEASPLAEGWRERIHLHQLHMLVVHCHLFGRGYVQETLACLRRYL